jgi:Ca2+-binding RTX toxin-like protein
MRTSYPLKRTRRVRWSVLTSAAALLATLLVGLSPSSVSASTLSTIPCAKTFTELIGTRYRSLGNSGGEEIYAGVPDLGTAARRTGANATWVAGDNFVSFTLDPVNDKLISSMSNSAGSWSVEYPNLAAQISTFHPGKSIADLDVLKIFMRNGDAQLGYVNVRDVEFDGTPIDADPYAAGMQDFTPSVFPPTVALDTWTITGLDFTDPAGWTMTARIERVGAFSTSQEATRVEFALGDGDLGAANVSVSGGGDVPEASGPAQFAVSVTGAMFTDVTVDYETTDGTATAPDDYEATSGSLTFPACDPAAPQTVDVPIVDDDDAEDNETFTLDLTSATGASIDAGTAVSTIVDDDEQLCNGLAPTVSGLVGTAGDDVIIGTEGSDVIDAGGGNDTVCGLGGNDTIKLGNGADWADGGDGDDIIEGNLGNDVIHGGAGNDTIRGHKGNDVIHGGDGNDKLLGAAGSDVLWGGDGDDTLTGGNGVDFLYGEGGNDVHKGGPGIDTCFDVTPGPPSDKFNGCEL